MRQQNHISTFGPFTYVLHNADRQHVHTCCTRSSPVKGRRHARQRAHHRDPADNPPPGAVHKIDLGLEDRVLPSKHMPYDTSPDDRLVTPRSVGMAPSSCSKSSCVTLCLRANVDQVFELVKNRVAILEAKKRFQYIEDGRPIVSDECLAQMTCEALVARLADPLEELGERFIVSY